MTDRALRLVTAVLVLTGGLIHLQEWAELLRHVPKIGPLFLVNVAAAGVVAVLLVVGRGTAGWLGIIGAFVLSMGTLGGFLLARYGTILGYSEPTWRTTAVLAAVVEVGAIVTASIAAVRRVEQGDLPQLATRFPGLAR